MNYEINEDTLAIISINHDASEVLEDTNKYNIPRSGYKVMDDSCKYFGSSYNGRKEGTKSILGIEYKVPIIVEDTKNMIFFPTTSPDDDKCIWLSLHNIKSFEKTAYNQTRIIFENDIEIIVPISYRSIENQIMRSTRLESIVRKRKNS